MSTSGARRCSAAAAACLHCHCQLLQPAVPAADLQAAGAAGVILVTAKECIRGAPTETAYTRTRALDIPHLNTEILAQFNYQTYLPRAPACSLLCIVAVCIFTCA